MSVSINEIKRIKDKKVFFVRVNEENYAKIGELAKNEERSIHWTVNNLLKKSLEDAKVKK